MADNFFLPLLAVNGLQRGKGFARQIEAIPADVVVKGRPADGGLARGDAAAHAVDDPLQHAEVFAEAGPEELAVRILAEPIHVEDLRRGAEVAAHADPVAEVVAHVVAAEGQHRQRITAYLADRAGSGGSGLRAHGGAGVDARNPVKSLVDERQGGGAAAAEEKGADRHAFGRFPGRVDGRALARRGGEAAVGVRRRGRGAGGPCIAAPVEDRQVLPRGRGVGHALPPDAFGHALADGERDVGEDRVAAERGHGIGVGLDARAGRYAEEAGLGIDGAQLTRCIWLNPGDVIAHGPHLPAREAGRRDQHGEIGFAAGRRKGRGEIGLFALRVFDAQNEHVLGHPAFVTSDVGGDAQRKALLAQQRVATIARAVAPDLARLREVDDVLGLIAGPGDVALAGRERLAHRMHAGHHALDVLVDLGQYRRADPRHDAHVHHGIGGVRQLHADAAHGRTDRPHGERQDVHGAAAHGAAKQPFQLAAHGERVFPVIGGAGVLLAQRADKGAVLDARNIVWRRAGVEAAGPEFFVQSGEGAGVDELVSELPVLGVGAVDPMDAVGLRELRHLLHPADQVLVRGAGTGWIGGCGGSFWSGDAGCGHGKVGCPFWMRHARLGYAVRAGGER